MAEKKEKTSGKKHRQEMPVKNLVMTAMFAAIAAVLMLFEFPIPFIAPAFYEIDLSEVPVLIGTFTMGPAAGILIEFLKILLKLLIKGTTTMYIGDLANFVIGCFFLIPAGLIYWHKKTSKSAVIGLVAGSLAMVIAGSLINAFVLLPLYAQLFMGGMDNIIAAGAAVNANITNVLTFVVIAVAPFNIVKAVIDSVLTMLLYKRVGFLIKKF